MDVRAQVFPDCGTIFPALVTHAAPGSIGGSNTTVVDQFRFTTLAAEIVNLNNSFTTGGTVRIWKSPLALVDENVSFVGTPPEFHTVVTGVGGCRGDLISSDAYVMPSRAGGYAISMNSNTEFSFHRVRDEENKETTHTAYFGSSGPAPGVDYAVFKHGIVGWDDDFDTIVIRIDVPATAAAQQFVLKIWKVTEYKPTFNSLLYSMSHESAKRNDQALTIYREMQRALPVAVEAKDNPSFLNDMLTAVRDVSGALTGLPGLAGVISGGVNALSRAIVPARGPVYQNTPTSPPLRPKARVKARPTRTARKPKPKARRRK